MDICSKGQQSAKIRDLSEESEVARTESRKRTSKIRLREKNVTLTVEEDGKLQNVTQGKNAEHGDLPQFGSGITKDRRLFLQRSVHVRQNGTLLAGRLFNALNV